MGFRDKVFGGKTPFLKVDDIKDGQKVEVTEVTVEDSKLANRGQQVVLRFKGIELPLGLNATNYDKMVEKFGDANDLAGLKQKWVGKTVKLVIGQAQNPQKGGKLGPALRIA